MDALANDTDPAGGVLVIQSVRLPAGSPLSVAIVDHHVLRVTDVRGATVPETFTYTVSNGRETSVGEVTVQPVKAPAKLQPPRAVADEITVRVNDVATVPVLLNDSHPDGAPLALKPQLAQSVAEADGLLGSLGRRSSVQSRSPSQDCPRHLCCGGAGWTGSISAGHHSHQGWGAEQNSRPEPKNLTARTIAGSTTRIQVPLDGIDPDGDSVSLIGLDKAPAQGTATVGATYLEYKAASKALGQDSFSYVVQDAMGVRNTATVTVGIGAASTNNQQPITVDDEIVALPGRDVAVDVLRNDSDPDGDALALVNGAVEADQALNATVEDGRIKFTTPDAPGALVIRYQASDGKGGFAGSTLTVDVRPDAPKKGPVARDDRISFAETLGKTAVDVPVLKNDEDPDGVTADLTVTLGSGTADASVGARGNVNVVLLPQARIIPYTATDLDGLATTAFIHVPGTLEQRPTLKNAGSVEVVSGKELVVNLTDAVVVRKDHSPRITVDSKVSAVASDGKGLVRDGATLVFTSSDDYSGPASMTFEVADGPLDAPGTLTSVLTISINVLPDPARNHAPSFTSTKADVVRGEETKVDLNQLVTDPDEADQGKLKVSLGQPQPEGFNASIDGSTLRIRADSDNPPSTAVLILSVSDPRGGSSQGTVELLLKPLLAAPAGGQRRRSARRQGGREPKHQRPHQRREPFPGESAPIGLCGC
ncbi:Ig-like domain-containing protein [Arthrobacter sp. SA17]